MSWAGLAGNQWISRTNVSDAIANGILGEVHSPGTSDKWCTWDEMHYFCNLPGAPTGTRWATKTDVLNYLPPATPAPYLIPVYFTHGVWNTTGPGHTGQGPSGWPSGIDACGMAGYVDYFRTYCSTSTIGVNSKLYSTPAGGYNPTIAGTGFDSSNPYFYAQSSYILLSIAGDGSWNVDSIVSCPTGYTVYYSWSNNYPAYFTYFYIYRNGSLYDSAYGNSSTSGSFSASPGDTMRVIVTVGAFEGATETISISGGSSYYSSGVDTAADSGDLISTGADVYVSGDAS